MDQLHWYPAVYIARSASGLGPTGWFQARRCNGAMAPMPARREMFRPRLTSHALHCEPQCTQAMDARQEVG